MTTFTSKEHYLSFKQAWAKAAQAGTLTAGHFLLYNLLVGRKPTIGFTPTYTPRKLEGRTGINSGICLAAMEIAGAQSWDVKQRMFLEPLGDTITPEMLKAVKVPKFQQLEFNYGIGKVIYNHLLANPMVLSYDNLNDLIHELTEQQQQKVV